MTDQFDRTQALAMIEDALSDVNNAQSRGLAFGVIGTLHVTGYISEEEWEAFCKRIPMVVQP